MSTARYDVVVVGGGLVGICCALYLQQTGRSVTIVEPAQPGDGASGHNAGIFSLANCLPTATPGVLKSLPRMLLDPLSPLAVRWSYVPRLAPWLVRFALNCRPSRVEAVSRALAPLLTQALPAYAPLMDGLDQSIVRPGGHLITYRSGASFDSALPGRILRARNGIKFEILSGDAIGHLDPALQGRFHAAMYIAEAPYVDPLHLTTVLTQLFRDRGGVIHRGSVNRFCADDRRVTSIETTSGVLVADEIVVAAGAWSRPLVRSLGFDVPLETERGYGVDLPAPNLDLKVPFISHDHHFALTPMRGGLRLAGTDELAGLRSPPDYRRADALVRAATTVFPEIEGDGAGTWLSFRPSLPDSLPVIGRAPTHDNVVLAFGHGHIGLTLAGITGQLVQQTVDRRPPAVDLSPYRADRFRMRRRRSPRSSRRCT